MPASLACHFHVLLQRTTLCRWHHPNAKDVLFTNFSPFCVHLKPGEMHSFSCLHHTFLKLSSLSLYL